MTDVINEYSEYEGLRSNELRRTVSVTTDVAAEPVEDDEGKKKTIRKQVIQFLRNFLAPNSVSLIVSIAIAMSPPLKALFVKSATRVLENSGKCHCSKINNSSHNWSGFDHRVLQRRLVRRR